MKSRLRGYGFNALKIGFAVGIVFWLIKTDRFKFQELAPFLEPFNLLSGFAIVGANLIIASERWRYLLGTQNFKLQFWTTWKLSQIGLFFNFAVPGGVGGDVVKAFYLQKDFQVPRAQAYSSVLMDRVLGLYTCVLMALVALIYESTLVLPEQADILQSLLSWVAVIFILMTVFLGFLIFTSWPQRYLNSHGLLGKLERFAGSCRQFAGSLPVLVRVIAMTVLAQFILILFFRWALIEILHEDVSWPILIFAVPVGFMVTSIPITPSGLGIGQAAFYFLFMTFSNGSIQSGSSAITAFQMLQFFWGLFGAYFYLTRKNKGLPIRNLTETG